MKFKLYCHTRAGGYLFNYNGFRIKCGMTKTSMSLRGAKRRSNLVFSSARGLLHFIRNDSYLFITTDYCQQMSNNYFLQ